MRRARQGVERGPWPWQPFFVEDPRPWILDGEEPAARWLLLTGVYDRPAHAGDVVDVRAAALADAGTADLISRLADWESDQHLSGHNNVSFAPNLLSLLADRGVRAGDDPRVDRVLDQMPAHQDSHDRFQSFGAVRSTEAAVWGSLPCDGHAITDVLVRYGRGSDPRVRAAFARIAQDLTPTAQGLAWPCRPDPVTGFRGPGRKDDFCPQVTVEALRLFARLPERDRPPDLLSVARVALNGWRHRASQKPYMFGHGKQFKTVKWPPTWYGAYGLLDALGRYPALWREPDADPAERRALAELAACLIAYNADAAGRVTPRSTYRELESHSFGQKKRPSAFATAQLLTVLHRLDDLAADAGAVDVTTLESSKGGTGIAVAPPARPREVLR